MNNLYVKIAISVTICMIIGFLSGTSTAEAINGWYGEINKPFFNPPNWIFAPVWTMLYAMMGVAAGLIWHQGLEKPVVKTALGIFGIQFILNTLWSYLFFGMQNPTLSLIEIIVLLGMIVLSIKQFMPLNKTAAYLLIPYLCWVSFATVLNMAIVYLN